MPHYTLFKPSKKGCPKKFIKVPKLPSKGLHPCAGCAEVFYDNGGLLTCPINQKIK